MKKNKTESVYVSYKKVDPQWQQIDLNVKVKL